MWWWQRYFQPNALRYGANDRVPTCALIHPSHLYLLAWARTLDYFSSCGNLLHMCAQEKVNPTYTHLVFTAVVWIGIELTKVPWHWISLPGRPHQTVATGLITCVDRPWASTIPPDPVVTTTVIVEASTQDNFLVVVIFLKLETANECICSTIQFAVTQ